MSYIREQFILGSSAGKLFASRQAKAEHLCVHFRRFPRIGSHLQCKCSSSIKKGNSNEKVLKDCFKN